MVSYLDEVNPIEPQSMFGLNFARLVGLWLTAGTFCVILVQFKVAEMSLRGIFVHWEKIKVTHYGTNSIHCNTWHDSWGKLLLYFGKL